MILELWMVGVAVAVLLAVRVPVGLAFIGPFMWWAIADGRSAGFSVKTAFDGVNSFPLLAVPLAGFTSGVVRAIIRIFTANRPDPVFETAEAS